MDELAELMLKKIDKLQKQNRMLFQEEKISGSLLEAVYDLAIKMNCVKIEILEELYKSIVEWG